MRVYDIPIGGSAGNLLGNPLCTNIEGGCWGKAFSCILLQESVNKNYHIAQHMHIIKSLFNILGGDICKFDWMGKDVFSIG